MAVGDFNGDGIPDLAVPVRTEGSVNIFLGNGDGSFKPTVAYPAGMSPWAVALTDLDGDGKTDLVLGNEALDGIQILLGNGDGTFQAAVRAPARFPNSVVAADVNGDGVADIVGVNVLNITTLLGAGSSAVTGTALQVSPNPVQLGQPVTLTTQVTPASATGEVEFLDGTTVLGIGQLNVSGQASIDFGLLSSGTHSLQAIYLGVPGVWQSSESAGMTEVVNTLAGRESPVSQVVNLSFSPTTLAVADFNADGIPDLAVGSLSESSSGSILLGNGDGTFRQASNITAFLPQSIAAADVNGDGKTDLLVGYEGGVDVFLGNGDGTFDYSKGYAAGDGAVVIADFNVDGKPDLAQAAYQQSGNITMMLGNGDGTFFYPQAPSYYAAGAYPISAATGDFNRDGYPDVAVANNGSNNVSVLLGNGDGSLQTAQNYPAGSAPSAIAAADVNGDGKVDLIVANSGSNNVSILLGNGDGSFQSATNFPAGPSPASIAVGDFNGDGKADVAVANSSSNTIGLLFSNGDGTFQSPIFHGAGSGPAFLVSSDFNRDGRLDLAVADSNSNSLSVLLFEPTPPRVPSKAGIWRPSVFNMVAEDVDGNLAWDSPPDQVDFFGETGDVVILGDWNGTGHDCMGIFRPSVAMFALDMNCNGQWDPGIDRFGFFGQTGDQPIVGDWTGDGKSKIGIYRPTTGLFALDVNNNLAYDAGTDRTGRFGSGGDTPIIGDWTGDGISKVGTFNQGLWWLDSNNDLARDSGDASGTIGQSGDTPLLGDWNGDGRTKVGIYRPSVGLFAEDYNGNLVWDQGTDRAGVLGPSGSIPVVGDWTGTGITRVGVIYGDSYWALDTNGNIVWDAGIQWGGFGATGDTPVVGRW